MSGPFVVWAAAAFPERLRCIASIHGANMATDAADSPHRVAAQIRCESYFACAEIDKWAPPADIDQLAAALRERRHAAPDRVVSRRRARLRLPRRAGVYDRDAAERHWERLFALFDRTLLHPPM